MDSLKLLHPELDAHTFSFDEALLYEIRSSYHSQLSPLLENPRNQYLFQGGQSHRVRVGESAPYFAQSYETYPLLWVSNNNDQTYSLFRRFFEALAIEGEVKKLVDYRERIVMYCGFLVVGDRAPATQWHSDYAQDSQAFTLITPLFELEPGHGHLLYRVGSQTERYQYKLGEAIFFGPKTDHTTEPYEPSERKRVLLSMTFGTDKLEHWPQLRESLDSQAQYFVLPCGHVSGRCKCLKTSRLERLGSWLYERLVPIKEITH